MQKTTRTSASNKRKPRRTNTRARVAARVPPANASIKKRNKTLADPVEKLANVAARTKAIGGVGTPVFARMLDDYDHNAEVRGELWYGQPGVLGIADKMLRDAHVRRSLDAITKPLRAALWDIKPASEDPIDLEIADFVRWNLFERIDFDCVLRLALTHLRYGFAFFEVLEEVGSVPTTRFKNHPGAGQGVFIKSFEHRPAWTVARWQTQKENAARLESIDQWLHGGDNEEGGFRNIPADRLLRFTCEQEGGNFAGLSVLRSAYGAWKTKLTFMVLEAIRHERQGVGTPTMTLPESAGDDEIDAAETILAQMRAHEKGYLVLPHGYEFKWSTTEGNGTAIAESIERCNRDIAFNVAAGFMLLGLSGDNGSYALAQSQEGQYQLTLDAEARYVANVFTHGVDGWSPIKRLVELNYGPQYAIPHLVARNMPTRNWAAVMPVVHNLIVSRGIIPDARLRAHIRESLMLPPEDPETREDMGYVSAAPQPTQEDENNLDFPSAGSLDQSQAQADDKKNVVKQKQNEKLSHFQRGVNHA
jgi:hypothetical protein